MKQVYIGLAILLVPTFFMTACAPLINPDKKPTLGELPLQDVMAVGDRYVAGMTNGSRETGSLLGLYEEGQRFAFPNLIVEQLNSLSEEERKREVIFRQHLNPVEGSGYFELEEVKFRSCDGEIIAEQVRLNPAIPDWIDLRPEAGEVDNFGIPFLRVGQLSKANVLPANPFFQRMIGPGQEVERFEDLWKDREPSLLFLWMGMEDILAYATRGAANTAFPLTPTSLFSQNLSSLMDSLEAASQDDFLAVLGNIPQIDRFPYFDALPHRFRTGEDCNELSADIYYENSDSLGGIRIATTEVSFLLSLRGRIGKNQGGGASFGLSRENPIPDYLVLDPSEKEDIRRAIEAYNRSIDSLINQANEGLDRPKWVLADLASVFENLEGGMNEGGLSVGLGHLSGGIFSLDGLTFSARGNAVIANEFMRAINQKADRGARLPLFSLPDYPGVIFP